MPRHGSWPPSTAQRGRLESRGSRKRGARAGGRSFVVNLVDSSRENGIAWGSPDRRATSQTLADLGRGVKAITEPTFAMAGQAISPLPAGTARFRDESPCGLRHVTHEQDAAAPGVAD